VAYGYHGRERKISSNWLTEADARVALTERQAAIAAGALERPTDRTSRRSRGVPELQAGAREAIRERRRADAQAPAASGARRQYAGADARRPDDRAARTDPGRVGECLDGWQTTSRCCGTCCGLARRWGYVTTVPEIMLPKHPEGRLRYLAETEIGKLLAACREPGNRYLTPVVILALHAGMRKGETSGSSGSGWTSRRRGSPSSRRRAASRGASRWGARSTRP
jgi:hypothetical protein